MNKKYQFSKEQEERFQLETVRQNGCALEYIDNPSEKVQLEAVRQDGVAVYFIDDPSLEVQLEAVREDGRAIEYIDNPSEEVQLEAIRHNGFAIEYIKNPSSYIKSIIDTINTSNQPIYVLHEPNKDPLFSIGCQCNITKDYFIWRIYNLYGRLEKNPYIREYIDIINKYIDKDERIDIDEKYQFTKEQEEKVQLEAVRQNGYNIKAIDNPSEEVQLEAVRQEAYAIEYIKNPSLELQLEVVRQNGRAIQYIDNPSEKVQLEAVKEDGSAIEFIKNPSEEIQLEAVRQDGRVIFYTKNPTSYIKSFVDVIETSGRHIYVLHEPNKEPLFSIGCQCNITKDYFIWRIYNLDGGLEKKPYRQEYLDALERY